jgi:hypothetical protein
LAINVGADCSFPIAQVRVEIDCCKRAEIKTPLGMHALSCRSRLVSPRLMRPELGVGELDGWREMENPSPKVPAADLAHWRTGSKSVELSDARPPGVLGFRRLGGVAAPLVALTALPSLFNAPWMTSQAARGDGR